MAWFVIARYRIEQGSLDRGSYGIRGHGGLDRRLIEWAQKNIFA